MFSVIVVTLALVCYGLEVAAARLRVTVKARRLASVPVPGSGLAFGDLLPSGVRGHAGRAVRG